MNCERCEKPIPPERLEAKPDATMCVTCLMAEGDEPMIQGHMVYSHKTAGEIQLVSRAQLDDINRLDPRGYFKGKEEREKDED